MRVICVIDMQNDFIDGSLGNEEAMKIVKPMEDYLEMFGAGNVIVATRDTHGEDYFLTNEGKHLPVPHCQEGTRGWQIRTSIADRLGNNLRIVDKPNFGISADRWKEILSDVDVTEIVLMGLCTDICVVSNALALKTAFPEIPVKVYRDLCAGVTVESHEAALTTMKMCQVDVMNSFEG